MKPVEASRATVDKHSFNDILFIPTLLILESCKRHTALALPTICQAALGRNLIFSTAWHYRACPQSRKTHLSCDHNGTAWAEV